MSVKLRMRPAMRFGTSSIFAIAILFLVINIAQIQSQYIPRDICRHVIQEFGWYPCRTNDCLDHEYLDWPVYSSLQQQCTQKCKSSSYGIACEYGDIYPTARSGISVGFNCQCSGQSSNAVCAGRQARIKTLNKEIRGRSKGMLSKARRACAFFCSTFRPGTIDNDHCTGYFITPYAIKDARYTPAVAKASKNKKASRRLPAYDNWICNCLGDKTAEDGGVIEGPETDF